MSLEKEIKTRIQNQQNPNFIISEATMDIGSSREFISKTLIDLKKQGEIFYIIKTPDILYITHIDGKEIEWKEDVHDTGNGLFDREGNIFINPSEFFEYISTLPASTKHENEILFKELEKLRGDEHAVKVLEIATKNIKLIRRLTFAVIENEELTESEIREYYGYVLRGLCRAVEKFDYKTGYSLSTLANQWILQGSTRARSKIIQKRMQDKYGEQVGLQKIEERARDIKNTTDQYPNFIQLEESFKKELQDKTITKQEREAQRLKDIEERLGINKLYNLLFTVGRKKFTYPSKEEVDNIFSSINLLDEQEKEIIIFRYGLNKLLKDYNINLDNFSELEEKLGHIDENGMTLEEIGSLYGLTRED